MASEASTHSTDRVGFVGLGSQGAPMAMRIIDEGFPTTVWARRSETLAPFLSTNASIAETPAGLGASADVLCVCVVDDAGVDDVLRGPKGALAAMKPGGVVVIHSTVHPETCRRLQADFPDVNIIDAPVSGGGDKAAARELVVMCGGPAASIERCRPILDSFANPLIHLGGLGCGQEAKLLNNAVFTAHLAIAADAFAAAARRGLDPQALTAVLTGGSGRSFALDVLSPRGGNLAEFGALAGPLLAKDVGILADLEPDSIIVEVAEYAVRAMNQSNGD